MNIGIEPLKEEIGARVVGVDLTRPLSEAEAEAISAAIDEYAVLVFHGQHITDEQQRAFTLNFGEIEEIRGGHVAKPEDSRLPDGIIDVSNIGKDGKPLARDHRTHLFNIGNMLWHSDSSFRAIPAAY